jgi:transposase-like protein
VTDQVVDELNTWQQRPLDRVYPVVLIDALHVKIREGDCPDLCVWGGDPAG